MIGWELKKISLSISEVLISIQIHILKGNVKIERTSKIVLFVVHIHLASIQN